MEILGYTFAVVIGVLIGVLGGGGSILSVPVLVYLFGLDAVAATTISLFVVGISSVFGSLGYIKSGNIQLKTVLYFGFPSVLGVLISRRVILPSLPETIFDFGEFVLTKNLFLLLFFAILMVVSAYKMIFNNSAANQNHCFAKNYYRLVVQGFFVGGITGLIGAGGGFLIVPALVLFLGLEMKKAVANSLVIISINSLLGFFFSMGSIVIDWKILLLFSGIAILGVGFGLWLSKKIDSKKLKPIFGWFILIMGAYIIIKELFFR